MVHAILKAWFDARGRPFVQGNADDFRTSEILKQFKSLRRSNARDEDIISQIQSRYTEDVSLETLAGMIGPWLLSLDDTEYALFVQTEICCASSARKALELVTQHLKSGTRLSLLSTNSNSTSEMIPPQLTYLPGSDVGGLDLMRFLDTARIYKLSPLENIFPSSL